MKRKTFTGIFASTLALTILMTGCGKENAYRPANGRYEISSQSENSTSGNSTVSNGGVVKNYGAAISAADIKKAYNDTENDDIMPLYNVSPTESFEFKFKKSWYETENNVSPSDIVTVHTDPACTEQSKLYTSNMFDEETATTLTVSPIGGVLTTDTEESNTIENKVEVWGNAPMYYIALWYDTEAEDYVKLDKPVVIPFTIKHELGVPTVKGVVDADGRFKLTWDAVEGADSYNIYWYGHVSPESHSTGEKNIPVPGAESAFDVHSESSLIKQSSTTETEFDNFAGKDHGLAIHYHDELDEDDVDYILGQNFCVNGSYFVTAVFGDKESSLSNIVNTDELILPYKVVEEVDPMFGRFEKENDLPKTLRVLNIDGSETVRNVSYKFHWGITLLGTPYPEFRYSVEGTAITGEVSMRTGTLLR